MLMLLSVLVISLPAPGVTDMVILESVIRCLKHMVTDMICHDIKPQLFDYQAESLCTKRSAMFDHVVDIPTRTRDDNE